MMAEPVDPRGVWQIEQVLALAPSPSAMAAAQPLAVPAKWVGTGCSGAAVWGRCTGSSGEPYECAVDHVAVAAACTCPSRRRPCKHVLALLLLWVRGQVPHAATPQAMQPRLSAAVPMQPAAAPVQPAAAPSGEPVADGGIAAPNSASGGASTAPTPPPAGPAPSRPDDRVARMAAGLAELDRWLLDRVRTGLSHPSLGEYRTWDDLAARLVNAQLSGLANRVRRLAGSVGAGPGWHEHVLAEVGLLHLLAQAGRHLGDLPGPLGESVAAALGWQVRQADVLAGVPVSDDWVVKGRSDVREDRIEVRRVWLRGRTTGEWAMVLSFAAYQQVLDTSLEVGTQVTADVFRYPGALGLRALVGVRHAAPVPALDVRCGSVAEACREVGRAVAREPWVERLPCSLRAAPARHGGGWVLTDDTGSLPLEASAPALATLLACSQGERVDMTAEWTPAGLVPLTIHLADRVVDIGPVADSSFVGAA